MTQRIILQKTPAEKREENPKLPYFRLVLPPEEEGGEWVDIGALWKAKTGNGYSGLLDESVTVSVKKKESEETKEYDKLQDDD